MFQFRVTWFVNSAGRRTLFRNGDSIACLKLMAQNMLDSARSMISNKLLCM